MAYIPRKNNSNTGRSPGRSAARPGKRSDRPALGEASPRPFTRGAYFQVKKPRWVPRPGNAVASTGTPRAYVPTGAPRKFGSTQAPQPFPQKPPYRPGGTTVTRAPYTKRFSASPTAKRPVRAGGRYGFLPKEGGKRSFGAKPFASKSSKPWEKGRSPARRLGTSPRASKTQLAKYTPKQATTSWGTVATWYDKHLASPDTYHEKVILPNLTRLVDAQKDELILDLAAGQGYFTRAFAKSGAQLTGLDISPELITIAKKEGGENIVYQVGSAEDLSVFKDGHFNKVVIVLAIQNIEHMHKVFSEAARVAKEGGALHIVMNHPAFRIPKQSSWGYAEKAGLQYRRDDQYLSESRSEIDMHPGMKDSPQTLSFHRSLQYYIKALVKAGFVVDRFEEWISHKDSDSGPRAKAENRARKEIPLFLYMRGKKI